MLFPPYSVPFAVVYWFPLAKPFGRAVWVRAMSLQMALGTSPSLSFGHRRAWRKMLALPLVSWGPCFFPFLWKRHLPFALSSVGWTVLAFPIHPNGSLLTPVTHFHSGKLQVSFSFWLLLLGAPHKQEQPGVGCGGGLCLAALSLFSSAGSAHYLKEVGLEQLVREAGPGPRQRVLIYPTDAIAWGWKVGDMLSFCNGASSPWLLPPQIHPLLFLSSLLAHCVC
jgi:hypothetical protein